MDLKEALKRFSIILSISIIFIGIIGPSAAVGLLASPGGFNIGFNTTKTYTGELTVENLGNETLNVVVSNKRLQKDNLHLLFSDEGIANWISVSPKNFTLAPKEKKTISFTVNVPDNVNYYDAEGALVIDGYPQNATSSTGNGITNVQVQQVPELVVPISVGLPGPINESLQFLDYNASAMFMTFVQGGFVYHVKNNGTVYANMTANIDLKGWFNEHHINATGVVYPDDNYYLTATWTPGLLDFGVYNVNTTIDYGRFGQDKSVQTQSSIFVLPIWLIILVILVPAIWFIRRKGISWPFQIQIKKK